MNPDIEMLDACSSASIPAQSSKVLNYITKTFDQIIHELQIRPPGNPQIVLNHIAALTPANGEDASAFPWHINSRTVTYSWPGKNKDEAWRFTCVGRILSEIQGSILNGITITKRDLYYRDPELFRRQETIDRYIDDIAHTCGVTRKDLFVTASPKGLVAGLNPNCNLPILVPDQQYGCSDAGLNHVRWILVIEKEASFKHLLEVGYHRLTTVIGPGLLITGKGYPDLATRRFLRSVLDRSEHQIPAFGLFDADPDGLDIFRCYCIGSKALGQEMAFNVPEMQRLNLGLTNMPHSKLIDFSLSLTAQNRKRARGMLVRPEWSEHFDAVCDLKNCRALLQQMLYLNRKAEIQILEELEGGTAAWLETKMLNTLNNA